MSPNLSNCQCKGSCVDCIKKYKGIVKNKIGVSKVLNNLRRIGWGSEFVEREELVISKRRSSVSASSSNTSSLNSSSGGGIEFCSTTTSVLDSSSPPTPNSPQPNCNSSLSLNSFSRNNTDFNQDFMESSVSGRIMREGQEEQ